MPFVCAADFTVNHFYGFGGNLWDSGWFAWLSTEARSWRLGNPPAIGGNFADDHFAQIFRLLTAAHDLVPGVPAPVWFALTQGLWFGLLGLACALCIMPRLARHPAAGAGLALLAVGNGITLATVGFPHIEIAIPALLFLTIALRGGERLRWLWPLPFVLLLSVREDAGLHAALAFAALGALRGWQARRWRPAMAEWSLALIGLLAGGAALLIQHLAFTNGGAGLSAEYLGQPPLAHLTAGFIAERAHHLFRDRSYVWAPLLLLGLQAAVWRDLRLLAGLLICLPWFSLSFIAIARQPGEMWSYYSFPLMIGLCWPMMAGQAFGVQGADARRYAMAQAALAVVSIGLFIGSGSNHQRQPWRYFGPEGWALVRPTEQAMDRLLAQRTELGRIIVDDRVAALRPGAFGPNEVRFAFDHSALEIAAADTLMEWPGGWLAGRKAELSRAAGFNHRMPVPGSRIVLHHRAWLPPDRGFDAQ